MVFEHVVLSLQCEVGLEVTFGKVRETNSSGTFRVAIEFDDEAVGLVCVDKGLEILNAAIDNIPFDIASELESLRSFAYDEALGPSTRSIVDAAKKRNIPWRRLNSGSLIQFGYGCRQRRICTAEADSTSAIAESIAQDKQLTRSLLKAVGVPVLKGDPSKVARMHGWPPKRLEFRSLLNLVRQSWPRRRNQSHDSRTGSRGLYRGPRTR